MKKHTKLFISGILMLGLSGSINAQNKPEVFKDIPRPHVELVIPQPTKIVITPEQLKVLVEDHKLIGKELVKDCFDSTVGHLCLDQIISFFGPEAEDNLHFRIVKHNQIPVPGESPYRVTIFIDQNNKINSIQRL